jgi:leucine-zipper of insertion element IS481
VQPSALPAQAGLGLAAPRDRSDASARRKRGQAYGEAGLADRSSRPHTSPRRTAARLQLAAKVLRRQQWTCEQIGAALEVSATTVARVLL